MSAIVETAGPPLRTRVEREAVRDVAPVALAVIPFGLVIAVTIVEQGLPLGIGYLSSLLIFAGSAQLAVLTLVGGGAGALAVVGAVAVINARLLVYGAALAPSFRRQPAWFRWLGPHLLVDQTYGLAAARTDLDDPARFRRYWLTIGAGIGTAWLVAIAAGLLLGPLLPASSPLDVATGALFVAMLVPRLSERRSMAVAAVAALVSVLGAGLPSGGGLPLAIVAGLVVGAIIAPKEEPPCAS
jgi:predicted branched-subunit amino acid permease